MKCAGNHQSSVCSKQHNSAPKCALCEKNHTANYKGCEVYQKKLKEQQTKKSTVVQRLQQKPTKPKEPAKAVTTDQSYAQAARKSEDKQANDQAKSIDSEPTMKDVMKMLKHFQTEVKDSLSQLSIRVEKLEKSNQPKQSQKRT